MKRWYYIVIFVVMILVGGYLAVVMVHYFQDRNQSVCETFNVEIDDFNEVQFVCSQELLNLVKAADLNPIGKRFTEIDLDAVEHVVAKHPMVHDAVCYRTMQGGICVHVSQRRPLFRVMTTTENYYVDKSREPFPTSIQSTVYVPVVSGAVTRNWVCDTLFDLVQYLHNDRFWCNQIEQIDVATDRSITLVPRVGSQLILLGKLNGYESKLRKLYTFYRKAMPHIGWNRYSAIDLRYKDQVICSQ